MAKSRVAYVCNECGAEFTKWQGQCGECQAWNSLAQIVLESAAAAGKPSPSRRASWTIIRPAATGVGRGRVDP